VNIWHARLGYIRQHRFDKLAKEGLLGQVVKMNLPTCESCLAGKRARKLFGKAIRVETRLQLIHFDICVGPLGYGYSRGFSLLINIFD